MSPATEAAAAEAMAQVIAPPSPEEVSEEIEVDLQFSAADAQGILLRWVHAVTSTSSAEFASMSSSAATADESVLGAGAEDAARGSAARPSSLLMARALQEMWEMPPEDTARRAEFSCCVEPLVTIVEQCDRRLGHHLVQRQPEQEQGQGQKQGQEQDDQAIGRPELEELLENTVLAVWNLASDADVSGQLGAQGAIPALASVLQLMGRSDRIAHALTGALMALSTDPEANRVRLRHHLDTDLVEEVVDFHRHRQELVFYACGLLCNMWGSATPSTATAARSGTTGDALIWLRGRTAGLRVATVCLVEHGAADAVADLALSSVCDLLPPPDPGSGENTAPEAADRHQRSSVRSAAKRIDHSAGSGRSLDAVEELMRPERGFCGGLLRALRTHAAVSETATTALCLLWHVTNHGQTYRRQLLVVGVVSAVVHVLCTQIRLKDMRTAAIAVSAVRLFAKDRFGRAKIFEPRTRDALAQAARDCIADQGVSDAFCSLFWGMLCGGDGARAPAGVGGRAPSSASSNQSQWFQSSLAQSVVVQNDEAASPVPQGTQQQRVLFTSPGEVLGPAGAGTRAGVGMGAGDSWAHSSAITSSEYNPFSITTEGSYFDQQPQFVSCVMPFSETAAASPADSAAAAVASSTHVMNAHFAYMRAAMQARRSSSSSSSSSVAQTHVTIGLAATSPAGMNGTRHASPIQRGGRGSELVASSDGYSQGGETGETETGTDGQDADEEERQLMYSAYAAMDVGPYLVAVLERHGQHRGIVRRVCAVLWRMTLAVEWFDRLHVLEAASSISEVLRCYGADADVVTQALYFVENLADDRSMAQQFASLGVAQSLFHVAWEHFERQDILSRCLWCLFLLCIHGGAREELLAVGDRSSGSSGSRNGYSNGGNGGGRHAAVAAAATVRMGRGSSPDLRQGPRQLRRAATAAATPHSSTLSTSTPIPYGDSSPLPHQTASPTSSIGSGGSSGGGGRGGSRSALSRSGMWSVFGRRSSPGRDRHGGAIGGVGVLLGDTLHHYADNDVIVRRACHLLLCVTSRRVANAHTSTRTSVSTPTPSSQQRSGRGVLSGRRGRMHAAVDRIVSSLLDSSPTAAVAVAVAAHPEEEDGSDAESDADEDNSTAHTPSASTKRTTFADVVATATAAAPASSTVADEATGDHVTRSRLASPLPPSPAVAGLSGLSSPRLRAAASAARAGLKVDLAAVRVMGAQGMCSALVHVLKQRHHVWPVNTFLACAIRNFCARKNQVNAARFYVCGLTPVLCKATIASLATARALDASVAKNELCPLVRSVDASMRAGALHTSALALADIGATTSSDTPEQQLQLTPQACSAAQAVLVAEFTRVVSFVCVLMQCVESLAHVKAARAAMLDGGLSDIVASAVQCAVAKLVFVSAPRGLRTGATTAEARMDDMEAATKHVWLRLAKLSCLALTALAVGVAQDATAASKSEAAAGGGPASSVGSPAVLHLLSTTLTLAGTTHQSQASQTGRAALARTVSWPSVRSFLATICETLESVEALHRSAYNATQYHRNQKQQQQQQQQGGRSPAGTPSTRMWQHRLAGFESHNLPEKLRAARGQLESSLERVATTTAL